MSVQPLQPPQNALYNDQGQRVKVDRAQYNLRWGEIWDANLKPGQLFDASASSPVLNHALEVDVGNLEGKRALVPGCGRGYDLATLARAGCSAAVGLDLAQSAVDAAIAWLDDGSGLSAAQREACRVLAADFFTFADKHGKFDIGYDYTFLCALHPDMREDWAKTWASLMEANGLLLTLIYPIDSARDPNKGPPWPVTPELYKQLLLPAGFTCVKLEPVPPALSHPNRAGQEYLGVWKLGSAES